MKETVKLIEVNAIPKPDIIIVNKYFIQTNPETGLPMQFILFCALDRKKAQSGDACEYPVYIPSSFTYKSPDHIKMSRLFMEHVPWVPVRCTDFSLYRYKVDDKYKYFAHASNFSVIDYEQVLGD